MKTSELRKSYLIKCAGPEVVRKNLRIHYCTVGSIIHPFLVASLANAIRSDLTTPKALDNCQVLENSRPFLYQYSFPKL